MLIDEKFVILQCAFSHYIACLTPVNPENNFDKIKPGTGVTIKTAILYPLPQIWFRLLQGL